MSEVLNVLRLRLRRFRHLWFHRKIRRRCRRCRRSLISWHLLVVCRRHHSDQPRFKHLRNRGDVVVNASPNNPVKNVVIFCWVDGKVELSSYRIASQLTVCVRGLLRYNYSCIVRKFQKQTTRPFEFICKRCANAQNNRILDRIACTQCIRFVLLLQMSHIICVSVCLYVCPWVGLVSQMCCVKTAEPIEMPFGAADSCGSLKPCIKWGQDWTNPFIRTPVIASCALAHIWVTCLETLVPGLFLEKFLVILLTEKLIDSYW